MHAGEAEVKTRITYAAEASERPHAAHTVPLHSEQARVVTAISAQEREPSGSLLQRSPSASTLDSVHSFESRSTSASSSGVRLRRRGQREGPWMIYDGLAGLRQQQHTQQRAQPGCYPAHAEPIYVTDRKANPQEPHANVMDAPCASEPPAVEAVDAQVR